MRNLPFYPEGADPLMHSRVVKGVRFVAIDDSAYLIRREQVEFWKAEAAKGDPVALVMHVPLYVPMNAHIRGQNLFSVVSNGEGKFLDVQIG